MKLNMHKCVHYAHRLYEYFPGILIFGAINLVIAVKTGILSDAHLAVVAFFAANAVFFSGVQVVAYLNRDKVPHAYLWRDPNKELPKESSYVTVVVKYRGSVRMCNAFYDTGLYPKYKGWGVPLAFLDADNEVIVWRHRVVQ